MRVSIDIRELPARLAEALAAFAAGNEVVVADGPTPRARLVPFDPKAPRIPDLHPGAMIPSPDFDDEIPLPP